LDAEKDHLAHDLVSPPRKSLMVNFPDASH
jgi:hypothetical protein